MMSLSLINIERFKSVKSASLHLAPLTLLAGSNGGGKSSVIQAILLAVSAVEQKNLPYLKELVSPFLQLDDVLCRWSDERTVQVELAWASQTLSVHFDAQCLHLDAKPSQSLAYEENLFYLSANRMGPEEVSRIDQSLTVGAEGQYILGAFERAKDRPIHAALLIEDAPSKTLKAQLAWWLSFVLSVEIEAVSERITSTSVKNAFHVADIGEVSPLNTGAGNSYLLKVLVMCLLAKPGDLLLIENPEIHLHPGAQSRLGNFLAFIAARGVQIIAETHCEHLLNRVRYEVYKDHIKGDDVVIHYKGSMEASFETIHINAAGHFVNNEGNEMSFPIGFFDSTLQELLEMG